MNPSPLKPTRHAPARGWLIILPTLAILALVLFLTDTTSAASLPLRVQTRTDQLTLQEQQPMCQTCHAEEYAVWKDSTHAKATLDPVFQEQLAKSHNQDECLKCHTTGFDTGSGKFMSEGVTCEACHGEFKEGHPAGQTMTLPSDAGTCRMCHEAAFAGWEKSKHAAQQIECFDCHQAHTQGVRTGSPETLCAACHSDEQTKLAHSVHGINGVDCGSCHMVKEMTDTADVSAAHGSASSHTFAVPADVCNRCHSDATHQTGSTQATTSQAPQGPAGTDQTALTSTRVKELETELNAAEKRLDSLRSVAVVGLGLALGVGGFLGLIVGVAGMSLWRPKSSRETK